MSKKILFVQLPPPRFSMKENVDNIPLAAAFLTSVIRQSNVPYEIEILPSDLADNLSDHALVEAIVNMRPDILLFTLYVWNSKRSLFIASQVKQRLPFTQVVAGGPEVTFDNAWIAKHPALDMGVVGEGESRILQVLSFLFSKAKNLPAGTYIKKSNIFRCNQEQPKPFDLADLEDPYSLGLISNSNSGKMFLETARGCKFRCAYCYYHKAFPCVQLHTERNVLAALMYAYHSDSPVREIYLMDPTFNARPRYQDLLWQIQTLRKTKDVELHTELRADLLSKKDVNLLKAAGLKSAEIGLQSIHPAVLKKVGRNHNLKKFEQGALLLKKAGIQVITGIIAGLPGDTVEGFLETIDWIQKTGVYDIVHPFVLSILPGTKLRQDAKKLHLSFDQQPPYYVTKTPNFSSADLSHVLLTTEKRFKKALSTIETYSQSELHVFEEDWHRKSLNLVSKISYWCRDPTQKEKISKELLHVLNKATDPFIFHFKSRKNSSLTTSEETVIFNLLRRFQERNPFTILEIVFEFRMPPSKKLLHKIISELSFPSHYINRFFAPLYNVDGKGSILSINFSILPPKNTSSKMRKIWRDDYDGLATVL